MAIQSAMKASPKIDGKVIFALTLVHFTGDFYSSFLIPLLPAFAERFALTLAQVGLIAGLSRFMAFIVQPCAGYIADHYRTRIFVLGGPFMAVFFLSLIGIAPSYPVLILFVALGSMGVSMLHPTCAGMVSTYAGRNFGLSMSLFNMGGTLAFGMGPVFITYFVRTFGLNASPYAMIIGMTVMVYLFKAVPLPAGEGLRDLGFIGSIRESLGSVWQAVLLIWVVMVLRAFAGQSFLTFVPLLYTQEGHSLVSAGIMISLYTVAGAISGLLAGHLSDRIGYKPVFLVTHALATPGLYLLLYAPGNWLYAGAFGAGFFVLATLPLGLAMAQKLAPRGKSMVSSLMMGLAFGTGGLMTPIAGKLADIFSIRDVLSFMALIPLLTTPLILMLPGSKGRFPRDRE